MLLPTKVLNQQLYTVYSINLFQTNYVQKGKEKVRFIKFFKEVSSAPSLHLFDPKYSKSNNIVKYFYYLK